MAAHKLSESEVRARVARTPWLYVSYIDTDNVLVTCPGCSRNLWRTLRDLERSKACIACYERLPAGKPRKTHEEIARLIAGNEDELRSEYQNSDKKILILFSDCGHEWWTSWHNYQHGYRCGHPDCVSKKNRESSLRRVGKERGAVGSAHPNWKSSVSNKYREADCPGYREWVLRVFRRDQFKCRRCSSKKDIEAHHILNYYSHVELRVVDDNGITLCKECHDEFHRDHGNVANTQEQIDKFLKRPKDSLLNIMMGLLNK